MTEESGGEELNTMGLMWQELTVIIIIMVAAIAMSLIVSKSLTADLTADLETQRFMTLEGVRHCFLYEENGRVYYDSIDLEKFTDASMENCLGEIRAIANLRQGDEVLGTVKTPGGSYNRVYGFNVNVHGKEGIYRLVVGLTE